MKNLNLTVFTLKPNNKMKKKNIIKMILAYHGYDFSLIESYRSGGTQETIVTVWEIEAENKYINDSISISESSFEEALYELLSELKSNRLVVLNHIDEFEFKKFI